MQEPPGRRAGGLGERRRNVQDLGPDQRGARTASRVAAGAHVRRPLARHKRGFVESRVAARGDGVGRQDGAIVGCGDERLRRRTAGARQFCLLCGPAPFDGRHGKF